MSGLAPETAERRRAVRQLLRDPLLAAQSGETLSLVRRHSGWLQAFFLDTFGWTLHVERELARLGKTPGDTSSASRATRPAEAIPFSKRRYTVLCLALAVAHRMDRQTTLQKIAEGVVGLAASDPALGEAGFAFALTTRDERRELVAVVRALLELGVLRRVQGDEEAFIAEKGDALYRIDRAVLARLISARRPPSTLSMRTDAERVAALVEEPRVDSDDARRQALRHRLARRLVDDPVVYYADLSEEERDYLHRARAAILKPILDATGLIPEIRAEGIALVDPERELTDVALPEEGTAGHVALLVAEYLATCMRAGDKRVRRARIEQHLRELTEVHGKYWRKAAREPGAEARLVEEALDFLTALDLAKCIDRDVEPRPAIARFALLPPRMERS